MRATMIWPGYRQSAHTRRAGHISRQGGPGVRRQLTLGASAVMRQVKAKPERGTVWMRGIMARRPIKVAVVAQAAEIARIAWAMLRSCQPYRAAAAATA